MRLLLVSPDRLAPEMAGAGIRTWELAQALSAQYEVCVAAPAGSEAPAATLPVTTYVVNHPRSLKSIAADVDVVVAPPLPPRLVRGMRASWIVDLYNPEPFEGLEHQRARPLREQRLLDVLRIDRVSYAMLAGDAFVCASERQRDMWLGYLTAMRRLDSARYARDPELRTLIDVVPFGVPQSPPGQGERVVRGVELPEDARIMLWQGGLWDWLDPLTVVHALALLRSEDERWTLAFPGTGRPSHRAPMAMTARVRQLVDQLGLADAVWLRDGWTRYDQRHAPLLEADVGVSAHRSTLETRFAHRTRMLEYVWGRLPIVCTEGDEWSERIERERLGAVVRCGDPAAFAAAVRDVFERGKSAYAEALGNVADMMTWQRVARPLAAMIEREASTRSRTPPLIARALALRHTSAAIADLMLRRR